MIFKNGIRLIVALLVQTQIATAGGFGGGGDFQLDAFSCYSGFKVAPNEDLLIGLNVGLLNGRQPTLDYVEHKQIDGDFINPILLESVRSKDFKVNLDTVRDLIQIHTSDGALSVAASVQEVLSSSEQQKITTRVQVQGRNLTLSCLVDANHLRKLITVLNQ